MISRSPRCTGIAPRRPGLRMGDDGIEVVELRRPAQCRANVRGNRQIATGSPGRRTAPDSTPLTGPTIGRFLLD